MATCVVRAQSMCRGEIMQMHQIRYFLALCEELNFTRAARRCGVSQPSLTNAIGALERELAGALFYRRPAVALTPLGHAMLPYLTRIAYTADHARETAQAMTQRANSEMPPPMEPASHSEYSSSGS